MTQDESRFSPAVNRLWKLAKSRKYEELETAWLAAMGEDLSDAEGMLSVLDLLARRGDTELADSLLYYLLSEQVERAGAETALGTVEKAVALLPESAVLREEAGDIYQKACASFPAIEALTQMTLRSMDLPLPEAVRRMKVFLQLGPGAYVLEEKRPGRVAGFDPDAKLLRISFADGEKTYDAAAVGALKILARDDLRALAAFERERLGQLASDDPAELVILALRTFGREVSYRDLRQHLKDVIPPAAWAKWWADAKLKIKRSPLLNVSDGTQPTFFLRGQAIAYRDRVREIFDSADSIEERLVTVLDYLGESGAETPADLDLVKHFADGLARCLEKDAEPASAVGILSVIGRIRKTLPDAAAAPSRSLADVLSTAADPSSLFCSIASEKVAQCVLAFIRDALPDRWHDVYADVLPGASTESCRWIAAELSSHGRLDVLSGAAANMLTKPQVNARALVWLWKAACADEFGEVLAGIDRPTILLNLLRAAKSLKRGATMASDEQGKDFLGQVRSAISAKDYSFVREVVQKAGSSRAMEIYDAAQYNPGLSEHAQSEIFSVIHDIHPEHFEETVAPWEEDVTYSTDAGLQKRREEHARLVNVELAKAEKDIGRAAAFGDLSENSEYKAAIEQRDRLATKASMIQQELTKARRIDANKVTADHVTVGSRVETKNLATGETESFVFLGPWDSDPEKGIYSYLAPLSLAFMGKRKGDIVSWSANADERKWEIVDISSGVG